MFYPTLENRCLVCMDDEKNEIDEAIKDCGPDDVVEMLTEWLNEKSYCVETRQLDKFLADKGIVRKISEDDMGGGAPAPGLATLGNVGGMGNPTAPTNGGTNAGFYDATKSGSGDKFASLSVGTQAAGSKNKKKKGYKSLISYLDFVAKKAPKK
jgi:hypothetical protein